MAKTKKKKRIPDEVWLIIPDLHFPFHCPWYCELITKVIRKLDLMGVVQLGDFVDMWQVSRYDKDPARKETVVEDINSYKAQLQVWMGEMNYGSIWRQLVGNHEIRLDKYLHKNAPALHEVMRPLPELLGITEGHDKINVSWHPYHQWDSCQVADVTLHHGVYYNQHTAAGNLVKYNRKFIQGHNHRVQYVSNGELWSATMGHGSDESMTAHQPTPTGWQQCFGLLTVVDGCGNLDLCLTKQGTATVWGEFIRG
jgi:hypothetical protein